MPHIVPPRLEDLDEEARTEVERVAADRGYIPQQRLTLAMRPRTLKAINDLDDAVFNHGTLDRGFKLLIAEVASAAAGCHHCQAHAGYHAHESGIPTDKIEALWTFEQSELFHDAERAALSLAVAAARSPSLADATHFEDLRQFYDDAEIVEIMSVICMFGWNNRWNDAVATVTEGNPLQFAQQHLVAQGWERGKHVPS